MVGKTWRSRGQIARTQTLGKVLAIGLVGLMACAAPVAAEDTGVASTEVPPVVTEAPVEPTEAPPPPTEAPLPTEIPAPT